MSRRSSTGWLAGAAGLAVAVAAAWFGIDLGSGDGAQLADATAADSTATSAVGSTATTAAGHGGGAATATERATGTDGTSAIETCPLDTLPEEAADTVADVRAGGPFEHPDNDGTRFGNYEGRLPDQARDHYREYTVDTPGLDHRGARRIVTGGEPPEDPETWYYTADHYESFCEIPDA